MLVAKSCPTLSNPMDCVALQAPRSLGFSRRECWSGLPFPSPGNLPDPGTEPWSPTVQSDSLPSEPRGKRLISVETCSEMRAIYGGLRTHSSATQIPFRFPPGIESNVDIQVNSDLGWIWKLAVDIRLESPLTDSICCGRLLTGIFYTVDLSSFPQLVLEQVLIKSGLSWQPSRKESACNAAAAEALNLIPGWGRSPAAGHGNPLQYSCLQTPMDRGPGGLKSAG